MGDKTGIEWTDATWNPVTGCAKVSAGCKNCYAERDWIRLSANPKTVYYGRTFTDVQCHPQRLDQPRRWQKPRRIFVNSMSDLFHEDVPDIFIAKVFGVMANAEQHTFQVLTKRPERMLEWFGKLQREGLMVTLPAGNNLSIFAGMADSWPLKNVWIGVSVEDQATADERIPLLLQTPAAVRWVSAEPLLGPVSFEGMFANPSNAMDGTNALEELDWVVGGGESGTNEHVRHTRPDWVRDLRDQCAAVGVPFLFKQWGSRNEYGIRVGAKNAGRQLDGVIHDGYPD